MLPVNFRLIYTDDDEEDRLLFLEGLNQLDEPVEVFLFDNGLSLVHHLESVQDAELPSSIVCDMKMHLLDGLEVLRLLKKDARLKKFPSSYLQPHQACVTGKWCLLQGLRASLPNLHP